MCSPCCFLSVSFKYILNLFHFSQKRLQSLNDHPTGYEGKIQSVGYIHELAFQQHLIYTETLNRLCFQPYPFKHDLIWNHIHHKCPLQASRVTGYSGLLFVLTSSRWIPPNTLWLRLCSERSDIGLRLLGLISMKGWRRSSRKTQPPRSYLSMFKPS